MSIIYEALKKIEKKEDPKVAPTPFPVEKVAEPKEQQPQEEPSYRINKFVFFTAVGVGIFSLFLFLMHLFHSKPVVRESPSLERAYVKRDAVSYNQPKLERPAFINNALDESRNRSYYLQGIIYTEDSPFALINGKRVKRGERIGGAIVKSLSESGVELETKDGNIQLTLE
ncbi:MAG: hypothetical protein JSW17_03230 [Candidatus Omnitrophota bacterium]|nr:MAG: hypothetical protein JSW17_03230 [Candidatus Omnitrophota bacterium]